MNGREPELAAMLGQLAIMSVPEQAFVFDALGQAEREALRLFLSQEGGSAPSTALARLIDACRSEGAVPSMTQRAVGALMTAADTVGGKDEIAQALQNYAPAPSSIWARLASARSLRR